METATGLLWLIKPQRGEREQDEQRRIEHL
jgi:hypothetical protein